MAGDITLPVTEGGDITLRISDNLDSDAIHDNVAGEIAEIMEKTSPVDDDLLLMEDSANGNVKKKVKMSNLPGATQNVNSVFGRAGDIVAVADDYSADQVTNAFDKTSDDMDDITDGSIYVKTENNYSDAEKVVVGNTSGVNTGDQSSGDFDHNALQNTHNLTTDIDHTQIQNIGSNSHAVIDTHLANSSNPHGVLATQISDFDTEVANNTDVALNTTHRSSDGKDHSDVVLNNTHRSSTGVDHGYINQDVTSSASPEFDAIKLDPTASIPSYEEGKMFYDNVNKCMAFYNDESDSTLQIGQEIWLRAKNNTGLEITNGSVVYINGEDSGLPTIALAKADLPSTALSTIAIATHDIGIGAIGLATRIGTVRSLDTSGFTAGDRLYLSDVNAGEFVNVQPGSPSYSVFLGTCTFSDNGSGTIEAQINASGNTGDVIKIFNGAILEDHSISVSSTGSVVSLTLDDTGDFLSLFFNGGFSKFNIPASVNLTAGSDTAPTFNYVYIPESTKVLTVSTSGFPTDEQHTHVATVLVQSASSVVTDGPYKVHAWTDHLYDDIEEGHLTHINKWIRSQNATWEDGVDPTTSITVNGGAIDNVYFSNTSGNVLQLHSHSFPAKDMSVSDPAFVINDFTTKYDRITDLSDIDTDSLGNTLRSNNTYYSLIVWGVVSEEDVDSKLIINTPGGFYTNETDAISDPLGYSNFSIPSDYTGTGFLIARVVLRYQTSGSGTLTEIQTEDLRGLVPSTAAGGGGVVGDVEFSDNLFRIFNVLDNTKEVDFDVSAVSTSTKRTITMPDADVNLGTIGASPLSTKGDVYTYDSSDARLPVGTNGQIIEADSTEDTGLKWVDKTTAPVDSVHGRTGEVVSQSGDYTAAEVTNAFDKTADDADDVDDTSSTKKFTTASDISKLAGVEALAEVNNISDVNATDLTDGSDTTLHYHTADRNRSNHTGTQLSNTISDFDTEVSNNTDVVLNNAHRVDSTQAHSDYLLNSGTDVAVGPLKTTADNSSADTEYIPNVLYGTDATPPAANTVPIGTIYVQYTP